MTKPSTTNNTQSSSKTRVSWNINPMLTIIVCIFELEIKDKIFMTCQGDYDNQTSFFFSIFNKRCRKNLSIRKNERKFSENFLLFFDKKLALCNQGYIEALIIDRCMKNLHQWWELAIKILCLRERKIFSRQYDCLSIDFLRLQ